MGLPRLTLWMVWMWLGSTIGVWPQAGVDEWRQTGALSLDFGNEDAPAPGYDAVAGPGALYAAERGWGWVGPSPEIFQAEGADGVRPPEWGQGVAGREMTLRVNPGPGTWHLLVYLDDGYRNAHQVEARIGGVARTHNPRVFGQEEEPAEGPIDSLRAAQFRFEAGAEPVDLRFRQEGAGGVRLLCLRIHRVEPVEGELAAWFEERLRVLGRHDSTEPMDAIRTELGQRRDAPGLGSLSRYWEGQLEMLARAEAWYAMKGWDWVSVQTRTSMFTRYKLALSLLDALVEHPEGERFPLYERALWNRARLLHWIYLEQHLPEDGAAAARDVAEMRRRHPEDVRVGMYAGEKYRHEDGLRPAWPGAPDWSAAQYEARQRLRDVAHYWVDRQISNGEMGGKPDDDVETLRWWPILMFTGDAKVAGGYRRLADGVWHSPRVFRGYAREARDVEHSAEYIADTAPVLALFSGAKQHLDRLYPSFEYMRDLWTGRNEAGDVQFKSAWIGATSIETEAPRNRDLAMNARAVKAVRYWSRLTGEASSRELLRAWSLTWAKAAMGTEKGKPAGLFPASLRWPDAAVNGEEAGWHRANMFWHYFDWAGDAQLYDQLLFSWGQTGDERLLEPMRATLDLLAEWQDRPERKHAPEGSAGWAADLLLASPSFWGVVTQWRIETGDGRHDALLRAWGPPYLRFLLDGDRRGLAEAIEKTLLEVLRYNRPMRTEEVLFTDRIFVGKDAGAVSGEDLLAGMLTGNHVSDGMSPYYTVIWSGETDHLTALVGRRGDDFWEAEVFLHQEDPAKLELRWPRLRPGTYTLEMEAEGTTLRRQVDVRGGTTSEMVEVPGGRLVRIRLER